MKVNFFDYSKRKNSTSTPTGTGTEKEVVLKENTSVHDPVIVLSGGVNVSWNYAYIATFERYYFVRDIVSVKAGVTEYHLTEDVMASNKTAIGATKARILYSSTYGDSTIPDTRIAVKTTKAQKQSTSNTIIDSSLTGFYVVTVMSENGGPTGIGEVYYLDKTNMAKLAEALSDTSFVTAITQLFNGKLMDAILSIKWLPFMPPAASDAYVTSVSKITVGNTDTDTISGFSISALRANYYYIKHSNESLAIHKTYAKTDFRAIEPYTTGFLYLPGVGNVSVSMGDLVMGDTINIDVDEDYITGECHYTIKNANGDVIQTVKCDMSSSIPLGQITVNGAAVMNGLQTSVLGAIGMASANPLAAAAGAGALISGAAHTVLAANQRATSIVGSIDGRFFYDYRIIYTEFSVDTEDPAGSDYVDMRGRPVCATGLISNYAGYIQCEGASVLMAGSEQEREEVNAMLNGGFYYA